MSDLFDLTGEVVVVTGASQGLGRQFARVLAGRGAAVALAARQAEKLDALAKEITSAGGRALAVAMDVTSQPSIKAALDQAEAALGPVTVLINNAGVQRERAAVDLAETDWDAVIDTNLKGAFSCATEVARRMIARQQGGNVINIASVLGLCVMGTCRPTTHRRAGSSS